MQAISTRPFSRALYWKRYMRRMRSGDETIQSRVTVGGCSTEYKYKPLRQFTTMVGETWCYLLKQSQSNSLQGHTKRFSSYLGIEQSGSSWIVKKRVPRNFKNKLWQTEKKFFKNSSCGPEMISYK